MVKNYYRKREEKNENIVLWRFHHGYGEMP
jgi:hypothetical protein